MCLKTQKKVGYLYKAPDYKPGEDPMERDEVTWHHIWAPPATKTEPKEEPQGRFDYSLSEDNLATQTSPELFSVTHWSDGVLEQALGDCHEVVKQNSPGLFCFSTSWQLIHATLARYADTHPRQ